MNLLHRLKSRHPRLFPLVVALTVLGATGGYSAYARAAADDCCYPGAPCCHPGAPCCARHHASPHP